jgi:glycosyltransferase involved in cell wall biosynthesis
MKLSVILPNYNHAHLVGHALDSILSQSFVPYEVIVLDDGSTDDSLQVLRRYEQKHAILTIHAFKRNQGTVVACNQLLELATGDYILGFPADDIVLPGAFKRAARQIELHPGVGACCADYLMVDTTSGHIESHRLDWRKDAGLVTPSELAEVLRGGWLPSFTCFIRRDALHMGGYFPESLKWHADWFAYLAVAFRYGVCYVPEPFAARRRHADAYGTAGRRRREEQDQVLRSLIDVLKAPENRDVLPWFVRSGASLFFSGELDRLVMSDPSLWDPETLMIAQMPIWDHLQKCRSHINAMWDERMDAPLDPDLETFIRKALLSE